jgi:hypothetical protein
MQPHDTYAMADWSYSIHTKAVHIWLHTQCTTTATHHDQVFFYLNTSPTCAHPMVPLYAKRQFSYCYYYCYCYCYTLYHSPTKPTCVKVNAVISNHAVWAPCIQLDSFNPPPAFHPPSLTYDPAVSDGEGIIASSLTEVVYQNHIVVSFILRLKNLQRRNKTKV